LKNLNHEFEEFVFEAFQEYVRGYEE